MANVRMTYEQAICTIGDVPTFAIRSEKRALEQFPSLLDARDRMRLAACRAILKYRSRQRGRGIIHTLETGE